MRIDWKSPRLIAALVIITTYSLSVAAIMIRIGESTDFLWWVVGLFFLTWCVAPIAVPLFFRSWIITVGVAAVAIWGLREYNVQMFGPGARSTSPLAFTFLPIYQWLFVLVLIGLDWAANRFLTR